MTTRRIARAVAATATLAAVACTAPAADGRAPGTVRSRLAFEAPRPLPATPAGGVAPTAAVAPDGALAYAWVGADSGASVGTLHVAAEGRAPHELRDPVGPALLDPEAPPKLAYAPDGSLYALYLVTARSGSAARVWSDARLRLARSPDGGRTWEPPADVDAGGGARYRNDHALHVGPGGAVYVAWLADRGHGTDGDTTNTWVSRSADGGRTWAPPALVDPAKSCECCRVAVATDPRSAAGGASGTVYAAWRKQLPGGIRDIVVARSADGGRTWGAPARVHADDWQVDACPDAGPALATDAAGRVHVAWWTGRPGRAGVQYARSDDGARTFGAAVPLKLAAVSRASHVQLAVSPAGDAVYAAWDDGTLQVPRVALRASRDGGATFDSLQYLSTPGAAATFPSAVLAPGALTVLWRERGAGAGPAPAHAHQPGAAAAALMEPPLQRVVARTAALR